MKIENDNFSILFTTTDPGGKGDAEKIQGTTKDLPLLNPKNGTHKNY